MSLANLLTQATPDEGRMWSSSRTAERRLRDLAPDTTRLVLHLYERYAHQFDSETLAMFDDLNERARA